MGIVTNALALKRRIAPHAMQERDEALALLRRAHALMRATGWHRGATTEAPGDWKLGEALRQIEAETFEMLTRGNL